MHYHLRVADYSSHTFKLNLDVGRNCGCQHRKYAQRENFFRQGTRHRRSELEFGIDADHAIAPRSRLVIPIVGFGHNHRPYVTLVSHIIDAHKFGEFPVPAALLKPCAQIENRVRASELGVLVIHPNLAAVTHFNRRVKAAAGMPPYQFAKKIVARPVPAVPVRGWRQCPAACCPQAPAPQPQAFQ